MARDSSLVDQHRSRVRPKRTEIVSLYTEPPVNGTIMCLDELGPVIPRSYPPVAGWSPDGHRIKAFLDYSRGPEKIWVYGALRVRDGQALTLTGRSRNTAGYRQLLEALSTSPIPRATCT